MSCVNLREHLKKHGNPLGKNQDMYIKALYTSLAELSKDLTPMATDTISNAIPSIPYILQSEEMDQQLKDYVTSDVYDKGDQGQVDNKPKMPVFDIEALMNEAMNNATEMGKKLICNEKKL